MNAGQLRQRIAIQSPTETANSFGEVTQTWTTVATVWAKISPLTGRELYQAERIAAEASHKVTMRYLAGVIPKWRVLYGVRIFDINAILNIDERNIEMQLFCREAL